MVIRNTTPSALLASYVEGYSIDWVLTELGIDIRQLALLLTSDRPFSDTLIDRLVQVFPSYKKEWYDANFFVIQQSLT